MAGLGFGMRGRDTDARRRGGMMDNKRRRGGLGLGEEGYQTGEFRRGDREPAFDDSPEMGQDDQYSQPGYREAAADEDDANPRQRDPRNYDDYGDVYPHDDYGSSEATVSEQTNSDFKHRTKTSEPGDNWSPRDYGYEHRDVLGPMDEEIHTLPEPSGPDDEMEYWDKSKRSTDEMFDRWRAKLKAKGLSDDEIEEIINDAVSLHD